MAGVRPISQLRRACLFTLLMPPRRRLRRPEPVSQSHWGCRHALMDPSTPQAPCATHSRGPSNLSIPVSGRLDWLRLGVRASRRSLCFLLCSGSALLSNLGKPGYVKVEAFAAALLLELCTCTVQRPRGYPVSDDLNASMQGLGASKPFASMPLAAQSSAADSWANIRVITGTFYRWGKSLSANIGLGADNDGF